MELNSIAFIPDGNRRYARFANISLLESYSLGTKKAWNVIDWLEKFDEIKSGTFYTLSLENIKRKAFELNVLFRIFGKQLDRALASPKFNDKGIKLNFIGKTDLLPEKIQEKMRKVEAKTLDNRNIQINLAIGYNGQQEIIDAAKNFALDYSKNPELADNLSPEEFKKYLYSDSDFPDLIVRTSGVKRLSGFLPFQSAYSELVFLDKYWPEMTESDLDSAVHEYYSRKRTFGK